MRDRTVLSLFSGIGGLGWYTMPPMPRGAKPKLYPPELVRQVARFYGEGLTQAETAHRLGVSQKVIWNLMRRHGMSRRPAVKRNQTGEKNSSWKGGRSITPSGYVVVLAPDHPRATPAGYVFEHILVAEQTLGRPLVWFGPGDPRSEVIHHLDRDKANNDPSNIIVTTPRCHIEEHRDRRTGRVHAGVSNDAR